MENFDITNLNRTLQESYIHYDPNRIDFTINNSELALLEEAGNNFWKDLFFVCLGLSLPSMLNAFVCKSKLPTGWNNEIFLNALVGGITFFLCVISAILWYKTSRRFSQVIKQIKEKPRYRIPNT